MCTCSTTDHVLNTCGQTSHSYLVGVGARAQARPRSGGRTTDNRLHMLNNHIPRSYLSHFLISSSSGSTGINDSRKRVWPNPALALTLTVTNPTVPTLPNHTSSGSRLFRLIPLAFYLVSQVLRSDGRALIHLRVVSAVHRIYCDM